uniref:Transcriptional regulator, GntR family n=1 Tax=Solibacter usitatus (strain Ellin6076) TaxID=234267 RepID=Q01YF4_SOLUE
MTVVLKPIYQQITERLERDIRGGKYAAGQKFPSEAALIQRFGVSRITVGRAVRELQQRGLLDRVAGSGTYVRGAEQQRRGGLLFGLVIPNLGETEIFEPICQGIAASHDAVGHALLWAHADQGRLSEPRPSGSDPKEEQAIELARQSIARRVAGIFFAPLEFSASSARVNLRVMKLIEAARIPVVLLDRRPEESTGRRACDLVGIDNHRAGYIATEHLLRQGVRRVGFVRVEGQATTIKARVRGFHDALREFDAAGHVLTMPAAERFPLTTAIRECEAFVCANDRVAARIMQTLLAAGLRIPRDVRIVGIDDVNYAALLPVPLTTVHQPCRDIGETALRVMLERLDRPKMPARDVLLECSLVVRESCGAASMDLFPAESV